MNISEFDELTDQELVSEFLKTRDEEIFRKIFRRHTTALYLLALRLTGGAEADSQDLIQETWVRACYNLGNFRWKSALRTWLSGILINCFRDFSKNLSERNETNMPSEVSNNSFEQPNQTLYLEKIIKNLPLGYRQVLVLHDIEGYTHEEISRLLDINIGTSKSQLFHARKSVRKSLQAKQEKL